MDRASALAYEVREGEYIQVIDVQGRQCSDFLAFHRAKLEKGLERGMDGVTTRTLMGAAYPLPGLYSKFFDVDMDPLVQVVRDTVGRHDTFGLACTRRYYEDMGYPGHVNCTDNFNGQVDAVRDRVARRLGGRQLLLQHPYRGGQPARLGRALVAAGRLRPDEGDDGPRVRVVGVPGRHRPGERAGSAPTSTCASTRPRTASRRPSPIA